MINFPLFFQSLHSGCENDPIDLEGLHESVVDSDEDLADSMDVSIQLQISIIFISLLAVPPYNFCNFDTKMV